MTGARGPGAQPVPWAMGLTVAQHEVICNIAKTGNLLNLNFRNNYDWFKWADKAAGLGVVDRIGYGPKGWSFWWNDRPLCRLVMDGLISPHIMRLFDERKRKPWDGAREELEKVNRAAGRI